jgi:hypothetical protein
LEKWVEYGWLKVEPTSPEEITALFGIISRALKEESRTRLLGPTKLHRKSRSVLGYSQSVLSKSAFFLDRLICHIAD